MGKSPPPTAWAALRPDLLRALALALLTLLLWCAVENRWTVAGWQTPLAYLADPPKADVLLALAMIKASDEGHIHPIFSNTIPELGAPFTAGWDDFPVTEKPLLGLTGLLAGAIGIFAAANVAVMLAHVLTALSFYAACRLLGASWPWAFAGALVLALSRYLFAHGLHHLIVTYAWHVPLCLLVCDWLFRGPGLRFGEWRFLFALAVAFLTGVQNVYYGNLFVQLVLFAGLLQGWRRGWRAMLPAAAIIGMIMGAFLLMNLNTIFHDLAHGANERAVARDYHWLEVYGLKLVDMVVPPPDHPFPPFAAWGAAYARETLLSPGEIPPTAYLGLLGLAALGWLTLASLRRVAEHRTPPLEAWLVLWILLYAAVGGVNGVFGTLGLLLFRATTRYSFVILCIVLMAAVRRLSLLDRPRKLPAYAAAFAAVLIAFWDQTPSVSAKDVDAIARGVDSDRRFTEAIERRVPSGAMIFQIPIMDFPESPVGGVGAYDNLRPYLYAHGLRFSFGNVKGRPHNAWQREVAKLPFKDGIARLESYGFAAVYVNENAFPDHAASLVQAFRSSGWTDMITSERGDLLCVFLRPSTLPELPPVD